MTSICAILIAKPGKEAELENILLSILEPVSKEAGTLEYKIHRAIDNPGRFFFYEKYADRSAVDTHMATPHFKDLLVKLDGVSNGETDIVLYQEIGSIR